MSDDQDIADMDPMDMDFDGTDGIFPVPMRRIVQAGLLAFAAGSAAAAVWSFRSGLLWTGICILAVAAPLVLLYWFMLFVHPSRTRIIVSNGRLLVEAPPFVKAFTDLAGSRAFMADLKAEPGLAPLEKVRCMAYFGYRAGEFKTANGRQAYVAARGNHVLCIETPTRYLVLGPRDMDGLKAAVEAHTPVKGQGKGT